MNQVEIHTFRECFCDCFCVFSWLNMVKQWSITKCTNAQKCCQNIRNYTPNQILKCSFLLLAFTYWDGRRTTGMLIMLHFDARYLYSLLKNTEEEKTKKHGFKRFHWNSLFKFSQFCLNVCYNECYKITFISYIFFKTYQSGVYVGYTNYNKVYLSEIHFIHQT